MLTQKSVVAVKVDSPNIHSAFSISSERNYEKCIPQLSDKKHHLLSWISIQHKLALARQIVAELSQAHAHEK